MTSNQNYGRKNTIVSNDMRDLICKKYDNGKTAREISKDIEYKFTTVASIIRKYKNTGIKVSEKKGNCGRKKLLNEVDCENLKSIISDDASISLKEMKNKIEVDYNKTVSTSTLHRIIKSFEYSFKRIQLVPMRRNTENNIEARFSYARNILEIEEQKLVFIDEMGVNCSMRRRHGRAPLGETPRKSVTSIRSKNISIAAAVIKEGLLNFKIHVGAYNSENFVVFINDLLLKLEEENLNEMIIICDNVPFHKSVEIKRLVEQKGHSLVFLPPYTPQLNPIEEVFSAWKERIRAMNCETQESLFNAINSSSTHISRGHCLSYFRHMHSFLIKAILREEF